MSIVNAGSGKTEHPSQALLDLVTIFEHFKKLNNLTITICGDIRTSRVANSIIPILKRLGNEIKLCGPQELLPKKSDYSIVDLKEGLKSSDIVMFLRVQHERHQEKFDTNEYNGRYGLNEKNIELLNPQSIIMHPGPVNRDVEIQSQLVEHNQSKIFKQKENGVYARMAIFDWIING